MKEGSPKDSEQRPLVSRLSREELSNRSELLNAFFDEIPDRSVWLSRLRGESYMIYNKLTNRHSWLPDVYGDIVDAFYEEMKSHQAYVVPALVFTRKQSTELEKQHRFYVKLLILIGYEAGDEILSTEAGIEDLVVSRLIQRGVLKPKLNLDVLMDVKMLVEYGSYLKGIKDIRLFWGEAINAIKMDRLPTRLPTKGELNEWRPKPVRRQRSASDLFPRGVMKEYLLNELHIPDWSRRG